MYLLHFNCNCNLILNNETILYFYFIIIFREFNTAEPKDLFESLDAAANADNSLADYDDMTIAKYFASWSEKAGHPLLTVHVDHASGRMTVVQVSNEL